MPKMEYILPNQRIIPSTRCIGKKKQSHKHVQSKKKPKQKQRKKKH